MAQDRNSFYVTLPSNGSKNFFSKNTGSNYKNKLATDLELEGCWEVGMAEVQYTRSWKVLKEDGRISFVIFRNDLHGSIRNSLVKKANGNNFEPIHLRDRTYWNPNIAEMKVESGSIDVIHIDFANGNYSSPHMVAEYAETAINQHYNALEPLKNKYSSLEYDKLIKVQYDSLKKRIMFKAAISSVFLIIYEKDEMATLLGFEKPKTDSHFEAYQGADWIIAPNAPSAYSTPALYVYTDIIAQEHVGHDLVQLLRTVPVSGTHGEIVCRVFEKPYYKRVIKCFISSIEIQVNDDTGAQIDFGGEKVICVLHFRRCI